MFASSNKKYMMHKSDCDVKSCVEDASQIIDAFFDELMYK